jgi:hypothetical protein
LSSTTGLPKDVRLAAETHLAGGELLRVAVKREEFLKVREKNSNTRMMIKMMMIMMMKKKIIIIIIIIINREGQ